MTSGAEKKTLTSAEPGLTLPRGAPAAAQPKGAGEWEESAGWSPPTAPLSPSVEQLQEKFGELDTRGAERAKPPAWGAASGLDLRGAERARSPAGGAALRAAPAAASPPPQPQPAALTLPCQGAAGGGGAAGSPPAAAWRLPPTPAVWGAPAYGAQQVVRVPPGYLLVRAGREPPALRPTFDGQAEKLAYFLSQARIYLGRYGAAFPDDEARVSAIAESLDGEAAEWMMALHDVGAPELGGVEAFLEGLRERFEDPILTRRAELAMYSLRQGSRSVAEYIGQFRRIAQRLRGWPEQLLVCQFRDGLSREMYQGCLFRGFPDSLPAWYRLASTLELELRGRGLLTAPESRGREKRPPARRGRGSPPPTASGGPRRPAGGCFRCGEEGGHRPANCPAPRPASTPGAPSHPKTPNKERSGGAREAVQVSPESSDGEGSPTPDQPGVVFCEIDSQGEDRPTVSGATPHWLPRWGWWESPSQKRGRGRPFAALLESGCSRCFIGLKAVDSLGPKA